MCGRTPLSPNCVGRVSVCACVCEGKSFSECVCVCVCKSTSQCVGDTFKVFLQFQITLDLNIRNACL